MATMRKARALLGATVFAWLLGGCGSDAETSSAAAEPTDAGADRNVAPDGPDGGFEPPPVDAGDTEADASPPPNPYPIDAVVAWTGGKAYFFHAGDYIRYDLAEDTSDDGYPRPIDGAWPGLWPEGIDAAFSDVDGKAYFFSGADYARYDMAQDQVDPGFPRPIAEDWPGVWPSGIDAAFRDADRRAYFVRGGEIIRFDLIGAAVDPGYPRPVSDELPGVWSDGFDAALTASESALYLFRERDYLRFDLLTWTVEPGHPIDRTFYWPGLWDPHEGTGDPGPRLPTQFADQLHAKPSSDEVAARRARVAASITSEYVDLSDQYPLYLASIEDRLQVWGCGIFKRVVDDEYRFRCAADTSGPLTLDVSIMLVPYVDWRRATYHVEQTSQGDFTAEEGTPLSIFHADDDRFYIDAISSNGATGGISAGLHVRVRFLLDGVEKRVGFSHLNAKVPSAVLDAYAAAIPLPTGVTFGFVGYTGNLWMGAPPAIDGPYEGDGEGLPVSHSHIWFEDDPENHMKLTVPMRKALDYSGTYFFGGG